MIFNRSTFVGRLVLVAVVGWFASPAMAATDQVTSDVSQSGCSSFSPVSDAAGEVAAWQSNCDPVGANADGSIEIFRAPVGGAPIQITAGGGCTSARPSMNSDGSRIAFESSCNLTGANPDGNVEIFLWRNGNISQLTTSTGCDNLAPSIDSNGTFIAFDSTCNTSGTNNDGRGSEIFRISASGTLKQLTVDSVGACDSTSASIDGSGTLVAFDSDCNFTGENEDSAIEIFTVNASGVVKQRTMAADDSCSSVRPSMDASGSIVAFHSDCDFVNGNTDRSDEIFTVDFSLGIDQVTDAGPGSACASGEARMSSSGNALTFSSYCKINNSNADGSIEVFQSGVGQAQGGILAVTSGTNGCSSVGGAISADGTRVMLDSDCNLASGNADGSVEVFRTTACICGGPATRKNPPKASDALMTLSAAVKIRGCAICECDTNSDQMVSASDALRVLKAAVGQPDVTLICPVP